MTACAESQSTSRVPNRTRFLAVQTATRVQMQCDKKSLLAEADASKKRNLMAVGGHADNAVDLCAEDRQKTGHADNAVDLCAEDKVLTPSRARISSPLDTVREQRPYRTPNRNVTQVIRGSRS